MMRKIVLWGGGLMLTYAVAFGGWCVGRFDQVSDRMGQMQTAIAVNATTINEMHTQMDDRNIGSLPPFRCGSGLEADRGSHREDRGETGSHGRQAPIGRQYPSTK